MKKLTNFLILVQFGLLFSGTLFGQKGPEIDSLEQALKAAKEDTIKVNTLNLFSTRLFKKDDFNKAILYANEALQLAKNLDFKRGTANSYQILGSIRRMQSKYPEAIANFNYALTIFKEIGDRAGMAICYNNLGIAYKNQGKYDEALKCYSSSLKIKEEAGDKKGIAVSYHNLSNVLSNKGEYSAALKHLFAALKMFEEIRDTLNMTETLSNIGLVYKKQGDYSEALNIFNRIEIMTDKTGSKSQKAKLFTNIGIVHKHTGNYNESLRYHLMSMQLAEESEDRQSLARSYMNIATIYGILEHFEESMKYHSASMRIMEEIGDEKGIAASCNNIGNLLYNQNKFDEARIYYDRGRDIATKIGNKPILREIYFNLSKLDSSLASFHSATLQTKTDYWKRAYDNYKQYAALDTSIYNTESNHQIAEIKTRFETEKKDKEIELLSKENDLKALMMDKQKTSLIASELEAERNQKEVLLLGKSNEVQELKLYRFQEDIRLQKMEAEAKSKEMSLFFKDKELKEQELVKQKLLKNAVIAGTMMLIILGLLLFNRYQLARKLEKQQAVEMERQRISNDMHDDLGSGLSKIALLSEMLKQNSVNGQIKPVIEKISASAQEALEKMSEIVWSLNPRNDTLESLVAYIRKYAVEYMEIASIPCQVHLPENIPDELVTGEQRRNIFLAVKESLHNVVKHSEASLVDIRFINGGSHFEICIQDDGKGIDMNKKNSFGNGLRTMRERMNAIGGTYEIERNNGTEVKFAITLPGV